jgi:DNA-binding CsgD family transcriptional regulator
MSKNKSLKGIRESTPNELASNIINELLKSYKIDKTTLKSVLVEAVNKLERMESSIPISIFSSKITVLESLVKFFVEEEKLTLRQVAKILNRNEKNLWHTYNNAKKKFSGSLDLNSDVYVPKVLFAKSKCSPTEAVVLYLHEELELSYAQIANLLQRNQRTIWTTYKRARIKYEKT